MSSSAANMGQSGETLAAAGLGAPRYSGQRAPVNAAESNTYVELLCKFIQPLGNLRYITTYTNRTSATGATLLALQRPLRTAARTAADAVESAPTTTHRSRPSANSSSVRLFSA
jgi:hypothetical protein